MGSAKALLALTLQLALLGSLAAGVTAQQRYVVTNNNVNGANSATVYLAGGTTLNPTLTKVATIPTGGSGSPYGYFAANLVALARAGANECAFVSDGGSSDIAGINLASLTVTGQFKGSSTDLASSGIGLVAHNGYLYAAFTGSQTLATFAIGSGCTLTFLGDVPSVGLGTSSMDQLAANGNMLVVVYSDTSVASFNLSGGIPVSNGDLQHTTGVTQYGNQVGAVDITRDGHYALFGGFGGYTMVEVSDISSGKITPTVVYGGPDQSLGTGAGSNTIWLGPEEEYIYITNTFSFQVTAVPFDPKTGTVLPFASGGCIMNLKQLNKTASYPGSIVSAGPKEQGGITLYVAEDGASKPSSVSILHRSTSNGQCTLTESADSPVWDGVTTDLPSIAAYPPRPF